MNIPDNDRQGTSKAMVTGTTAGMRKAVVACLGASATVAIGSYDWIRDLAAATRQRVFAFLSDSPQGGDLAYNGLAAPARHHQLPSGLRDHSAWRQRCTSVDFKETLPVYATLETSSK